MRTEFVNQLTSVGIEESEAKQEISILFREFGEDNLAKIKEIVDKRIKDRTPLQYLIGKAYFMDFEVKVNKEVLIPRPETEILVEEAIKRFNKLKVETQQLTALDIGTGSGVIPIALAKLVPNIKIVAIDLNEKAIELASDNAKRCGVDQKICFKAYDLFSEKIEEIFKENSFDLIISNPPYIKDSEFAELEPEIYLHEPKIAHCGSIENKKGLVYHERIIKLAKKHFKTGILALEIDPPIVDSLRELLKKENLNDYEIIKDYAKLERCLFINLTF